MSDRRYQLLAHAILQDYGVPPALAIACARTLLIDDHSKLEQMCREAWGDERLAQVLAGDRGEA